MAISDAVVRVDAPANAREMSLVPQITLAAATVGAGLWAGHFYSFQISVIPVLAEVDDVTYVTTFQAINDKIMGPWLAIILYGPPLLIIAAWVLNRHASSLVKTLIGAGLVLNLATIAITGAGNIPLNDDLAEADVTTPEATAEVRDDFEDPWNRLNLARTIVSVAGFVALTTATVLRTNPRERSDHRFPTPDA